MNSIKKIPLIVATACMICLPFCTSHAITYIPSSESDGSYEAGQAAGSLLGALFSRNRRPHINVHKQYVYAGSNGSSAFYIDLSSAKSIKKTDTFKLASADFIYVDYTKEQIYKIKNHISYDVSSQVARVSLASMSTFDYKGKLLQGPVDGNGQFSDVNPQGPTAAAVNTVYNKLYGMAFYYDSSIPVLTKTGALVD